MGNLTQESIVDNIRCMLADGHRRLGRPVVLGVRAGLAAAGAAGEAPPAVKVPVGFTTFPARSGLPAQLVETVCPSLAYFKARSTAADTSRHGKNRPSSCRSCARRSSRCGKAWPGWGQTLGTRAAAAGRSRIAP